MSIAVPDSARHEVKFVARPTRYHEIRNWVRTHPMGFHSPFPSRRVNNAYFDNHSLFAFRENLVGASARSKVRLRWYGETRRPESCVLEVKRRRNLLGWKLSYATGAADFESDSWPAIQRALRAALPEDGRIWFDANPLPVLLNRYLRDYFVSRDDRVRVTLDREQAVYDQRLSSRPNLTRKSNLPDTMVVEFKFAAGDRRLGSQAIAGIPVRVSRNSKYVIGVQSLVGA